MFPPDISVTNLRPDMIIWSEKKKSVIIVELTVPWETATDEAHERKLLKYDELVSQCRREGWVTTLHAVEVSSRGFIAQSMWRLLKDLNVVGRDRKQAIHGMEEASVRGSAWIWKKSRWGNKHQGND